MRILEPNEFLDDFVLLAEFNKKASLSKNAYKSWKNHQVARYGGTRSLFLNKACILPKYALSLKECTSLNGFVLAAAFCSFSSLSPSHLVAKNKSKLYDLFELKIICGTKFINLKAFYDFLGLKYSYHLYIEKCRFFGPTPLEKRIKLSENMCVGYY